MIARLLATGLVLAAALPAAAQQTPIEGEVRRLDVAAEKLTIRHGPIASLDMPAMTMVFRVARPDMFQGLAVGDRVVFEVERSGGAITITAIRKAS
ncbi:MAG: copper-binding protein [Alphaproteobacteria bacterium]